MNSAQERYWDGWQWSRNTRPFEQTAPGAGYGQAPYSPYPAANGGGPNVRPPLGRPERVRVSVQATTTADGVPLASWWWRALAVVIDNVIISAIVTIITFPVWQSLYAAWTSYFDAVLEAQRLGVAPPTMSVTELISGRNQLILTVATIGIGMLYHVGFLRWKSATPGKLLCGLRVVPVDHGHATGPLAVELDFHPVGYLGAAQYQLLPQLDHGRGRAFPALASKTTGIARHGGEDPGHPPGFEPVCALSSSKRRPSTGAVLSLSMR